MENICVIGYGNQGRAQALNLKDSGFSVTVGTREGESRRMAVKDGFPAHEISEAIEKGDIIHILTPDEVMGDLYRRMYIKAGKAISFSHGFNIVYKQIIPPKDIDIIMVAPYGTGRELRESPSTPGLYSIYQDFTGRAVKRALSLAEGIRLKPCMNATFEQETFLDLFGEQNVINGGVVNLILAGFEVLTEAGYPAELAYFETLHQLRMVADLLQKVGIGKFNESISNTAEYDQYINGPFVIDGSVKDRMKESLKRIEDGSFAEKWISEYRKGSKELLRRRKEIKSHPIEKVDRD